MKMKLLAYRELQEFPSGSGIEFYDDKVYIAGDDANRLLITGKKWKKLKFARIFDESQERIPKKTKPDLEATTVVAVKGVPHLCLIGSGSKEPRNRMVLFNLQDRTHQVVDIGVFYQRLREGGFPDLNIEGAATIGGQIVLANRGNKSHPHNHLLVTDTEFWLRQEQATLRSYRLDLGSQAVNSGISGLAYSCTQDRLWFTLSTEDTVNSYDDGPIGKSYLGVVERAGKILHDGAVTISPDKLIDLAVADDLFRGQKIESVCIEREKADRIKLQLVADNDTGSTHLFRLRLKNLSTQTVYPG